MERRSAEDWDGGKLEKLAMEYMNMRKDMWTMLAAKVGEKWQVIESKVSVHLYDLCYHNFLFRLVVLFAANSMTVHGEGIEEPSVRRKERLTT
jgi:hypothetical protein